MCEELDDLEGVATALNILGDIHRRVGDLDVAETHLRKSVEMTPPSGFDLVTSDSLQCLALVVSQRGNHDEALTLVDAAIERARRATSTLVEGRSRIVQGYVLLASGRAEAAVEPLRAGLAEMQRLGQDEYFGWVLCWGGKRRVDQPCSLELSSFIRSAQQSAVAPRPSPTQGQR